MYALSRWYKRICIHVHVRHDELVNLKAKEMEYQNELVRLKAKEMKYLQTIESLEAQVNPKPHHHS